MNKKFDFEETFNPEEYLYFYRDILTPERLKREIDFLLKYTELDKSLKFLILHVVMAVMRMPLPVLAIKSQVST